jgi:hypothetical protein
MIVTPQSELGLKLQDLARQYGNIKTQLETHSQYDQMREEKFTSETLPSDLSGFVSSYASVVREYRNEGIHVDSVVPWNLLKSIWDQEDKDHEVILEPLKKPVLEEIMDSGSISYTPQPVVWKNPIPFVKNITAYESIGKGLEAGSHLLQRLLAFSIVGGVASSCYMYAADHPNYSSMFLLTGGLFTLGISIDVLAQRTFSNHDGNTTLHHPVSRGEIKIITK